MSAAFKGNIHRGSTIAVDHKWHEIRITDEHVSVMIAVDDVDDAYRLEDAVRELLRTMKPDGLVEIPARGETP